MTFKDKTTYKPTIGLEIHVQLNTKTKMFSRSKNDPNEKDPNVNVSPVDLGHPGTLPTINKEAVKHVLKVGVALEGQLADYSEFDRKNYFYPDIPKGYQISQYKYPLVSGGELAGVAITRIHLEEDTGRSLHSEGEYSLVDYNRAGIPLMELVTEPVIHSAKDAANFARELQLLLRSLGVSNANLEKGEMRVEANISISRTSDLGTKVEVKNLNSFKAVERAIEYEIERHAKILDEKGELTQETRGWDENKQKTFSQRSKEEAHDYRYFPDPDLPKLKLSEIKEFDSDVLLKEMPELPWEIRDRFKKEYTLKEDDIEVYVEDSILRKLFEETAVLLGSYPKSIFQTLSNYITSDLVGLIKSENGNIGNVTPVSLKELVEMIHNDEISSRGAKDTLRFLFENGGAAREVATKNNLLQTSDVDNLREILENILSSHPEIVEEYRNGKESVAQFFIGQAMRETQGRANPEILKTLLSELLKT